ncbi:restriction endonuclease subunit S [Bacillus anthracis]|nr:restriction endonuclease subunit S [Bacillus cereus]MDR4407243.1 restriction endonuclease subunit S [Bacillus anthracis]
MDKLLDGVEVEWKAIWEVTTWDKKFNGLSREKQPTVINYPYLLAADLFKLEQDEGDVFLLSTGERTGWTTEELAGEYIREGEVVTIPWGKSRPLKDVLKYYKGRFVTADNRIATSSNTDKMLNKFLYYWLLSQSKLIDGFYRGSGIQHPNMAAVLDMKIPIPPLHIQKEIVRILDAFSELTLELTSELTLELTARKKQYKYYRDKLLTFEEGNFERKRLGDVGEFIYGYAAKAQDSGDARFIRITDINTNGKLIPTDAKFVDISEENERFILEKNDLLMARTGATFGKTMIFEEDYPAIFAGFLIKLSFDKKIINPKYYWHFSQSELFWHQANKLVSGGGQPQFNANAVREVKIPIPYPDNPDKSLVEQARIVAILDKFDALTSSITEDLRNGIELYQKQYEYYRNMLLSFPKEEVEE